MSSKATVTLDQHSTDYVLDCVSQGAYRSKDDVVRAALRLLEDQDGRIKALQAAILEAEESGPSAPFDAAEFLAEMHNRHGL